MTTRLMPPRRFVLALAAMVVFASSLLVTPQAQAADVTMDFLGWSPNGNQISNGEEKYPKFKLTNPQKKNIAVKVTSTISSSCTITAVKQRTEDVIVGAGQSVEVQDTTVKGSANCNKAALKWNAEFRYTFTDKQPSASPSPSPSASSTVESPSPEASAEPTPEQQPASSAAAPAKKEEKKESEGPGALPFLLGFLGLLILILVGGIIVFASKQRGAN